MRRHGKGHSYYVGKQKVPGVTTVLDVINKAGLMRWAANVEREMVIETSGTVFQELVANIASAIASGADYERIRIPDDRWRAELESALGRKRAHEKLKDDAADIGKQTHSLIEWYWASMLFGADAGPDPGPEPVIDRAEVESCYKSFREWARAVDLAPLASEIAVVSRGRWVAGTLDHLALIEGRVGITDWKSAKSIYYQHVLQVVGYRACYNEEPMVRGVSQVEDCYIIQLPKTPEIGTAAKVEKVTELDRYEDEFNTAVKLHRAVQRWEDAHPWRDKYKPKPAPGVGEETAA